MAHTVSKVLTDASLNRIMAIESRGKPRAKAPTSSAFGLFQFLDQTWIDTLKKHRPDLAARSRKQALALRSNTTVCIEIGARFTEDNARGIGHGFTDGDLYLAHFLGLGAARKFFHADPQASSAAIAGPKAVAANKSIFSSHKTAGSLRAWAANSMSHRWDECGNVDWVKQYYDPQDPLAEHHEEEEDHEVLDHDPPVKHEENFQEDQEDDNGDATEPLPRPRPREADDDTEEETSTPSFLDTAKSLVKSKIAWLAGLLGVSGASGSASSDPDTLHLLAQLVLKPAFLLMLAAIVTAVAIIYFRWKDYGKGAK